MRQSSRFGCETAKTILHTNTARDTPKKPTVCAGSSYIVGAEDGGELVFNSVIDGLEQCGLL
eukprot:1519110-Amphidinium_carterae.1